MKIGFYAVDNELMGGAWTNEEGIVEFSESLRFLAKAPVIGAEDTIFTVRDGDDYLRAMLRQYSGSYCRAIEVRQDRSLP